MTQIGSLRKLVARNSGESRLAQWMAQHHDAIETMLVASGRRRWTVVSEFALENGLMDGSGKPPSAQTTKQTWKRVKARVARIRAAKAQYANRAPPTRPLPVTVHLQDALPLPAQHYPAPAAPSRSAQPSLPPARNPFPIDVDMDEPAPRLSVFKTIR